MIVRRFVVQNVDLFYRASRFLSLAVISNYLTKVAGKMLASETKRLNVSRSSHSQGNTTKVVHGHTGSNFEIPRGSLILLSILAFCLLALLAMYLILRRCERRLMDQLGGKGRRSNEYQLGSPESGVKDWEISENDYELYPLALNTKKQVHQNVHQKHPTLRTAVMQVSVTYFPNTGRLVIEIARLESVSKKILQSGIASSVEVHARLQPLPDKFRCKTSSKRITKAEFHERFAFDGFSKHDLRKCWFRFRLYSQRRMGKNKLLGQVNVGVMDFEVDGIWSTLSLDILPSEEVYKLLTNAE